MAAGGGAGSQGDKGQGSGGGRGWGQGCQPPNRCPSAPGKPGKQGVLPRWVHGVDILILFFRLYRQGGVPVGVGLLQGGPLGHLGRWGGPPGRCCAWAWSLSLLGCTELLQGEPLGHLGRLCGSCWGGGAGGECWGGGQGPRALSRGPFIFIYNPGPTSRGAYIENYDPGPIGRGLQSFSYKPGPTSRGLRSFRYIAYTELIH